jgi:release factor glutamine methyltransferase
MAKCKKQNKWPVFPKRSGTLAVMRSHILYQSLVGSLTLKVSEDEKQTMIRWLLEDRLGLSTAALLSGKETPFTQAHFARDLERLNAEEPIHYVLGHTSFYGRQFRVNTSVLIPRPETESLVRLVLEHSRSNRGGRYLDIGTGSGCIAITLALELPGSEVHATDISKEALSVATENARLLQAPVQFHQHDILNEELPFADLDVVVSNPPYIRKKEAVSMAKNVMDHEPHTALFVPDEDPTIFYRAIAMKARLVLKAGGLLAVEINERLGNETLEAIERAGFFGAQILKDTQEKERFITALASV